MEEEDLELIIKKAVKEALEEKVNEEKKKFIIFTIP